MTFHFPWVLEHTTKETNLQWLIVTGVGFVFVVWLILKFVWPGMIRPHLVERQASIVHAAEQVAATLREMETLRNDYRQRLEQIHEETQRRIAEAVQEAELLGATILAEARDDAAAILRRGEEEVSRERAKAMVHLRRQFVQGVIGAAQFASTRSLTDSDHRRLVAGFIDDLGVKA